MKNKIKQKLILSSLGFLVFSSGAYLLISKGKTVKASAYSAVSAGSLTKNIDLNDVDSNDIRSYYSDLTKLTSDELTGNNLLKNLKPILKKEQIYYAYDNAIWNIYEIADRDWEKSPAKDIDGYDASTGKITSYAYKKTDPYVHALYINRDVENKTVAWADHNQDQWGINREHVWAKSHGFNADTVSNGGKGGARGDPMHLIAGNGYANNIHSNNFYGYVDTTKTYTDCGTKYSNLSGNLLGTSKTLGTGTVFEPQDDDKGDIARAIFYMVARYNYLSGSDTDGIDHNNPNLKLVQSASDSNGTSSYTSSTTVFGEMGLISDLLEWNRLDPVSDYEIHRNNLLYRNYTNNRNPFIDFPEWAEYIWGSSENGVYSSTPTGSADPSKNAISSFANKTVSSIATAGQTTSYMVGDTFSYDGTCTATYSDGTKAAVNPTVDKSKVNMSTGGTYTVGLSYTEDAVTVKTSYNITVNEDEPEAIQGTYAIEFKGNGKETDSSSAYTTNTQLKSISDSNTLATTIAATTRTYAGRGQTGLKLGSKSDVGSLELNLNIGVKADISYIEIETAQYGEEASTRFSISLGNTLLEDDIAPGDGVYRYRFDANDLGSGTTLTIASTKRAYLKRIEVGVDVSSTVYASSVTLNSSQKTLAIDDTHSLTATVLPITTNDKTVAWHSTNPKVATVSNGGSVTAIAPGRAEIIATTSNGKTAKCVINVKDDSRNAVLTPENLTTFYGIETSNNVVVNPQYSNEILMPKNGSTIEFKDYMDIYKIVISQYGTYNNLTVHLEDIDNEATDATSYEDVSSNRTYTYELEDVVNYFVIKNDAGYNVNLFSVTVYYITTTKEQNVQAWANDYLYMDSYTTSLGYCKDMSHDYYGNAKTALLDLDSDDIDEFKNNSLFSDMKARYLAWAAANDDANPYSATPSASTITRTDINSSVIIVIICLTTVTSIVVFYAIRKRSINR